MTSAPIATWLLKRFVTGPHAEAIVGDLLERFNQDGSVLWLWQQVLSAIVVSAVQHVRHRYLVTLRVHPKGLLALAAIVLVAKLAGAMFIVGVIWVLMVAPLWFNLVYTLGRRRFPKIPSRL
jgi:hypothetical protein